MQGTRVRSLVREGATCRPVKPVCHHHRALRVLVPVLCTQRSHRSEKPTYRDVGAQRAAGAGAEKPEGSREGAAQPRQMNKHVFKIEK